MHSHSVLKSSFFSHLLNYRVSMVAVFIHVEATYRRYCTFATGLIFCKPYDLLFRYPAPGYYFVSNIVSL